MTEKQLFYPLLSVYFSLILGDLQKEKLQIVSIFRFGHKKGGLFQCPPKGVGLPLFVSAENIASSLLKYSCEYEKKEYYNNGIGSDSADRL